MTRFALGIVGVAALAVTAVAPGVAQAAQPKLKGNLIEAPATLTGLTGSCQCDWQWYTVGLRPGTVSLTATLRRDGPIMAPSYALFVSLIRGGSVLKTVQVSCSSTRPRCGRHVTLSHRIATSGVYYLLVRGEGSAAMQFSVQVRGKLYPLHCRSSCT
ncbi:MAG: hypothetical protein ACR2JC_19360 [Chloroflexota bacterium]